MTQPANAHAAVVLAAGGSTRLGRPKQLLTRDGETLVHRALRLAHETHPRQLLLVSGATRDGVVGACQGLPMQEVFNDRWRDGLASSLRLAANALANHLGPVLVLACDQPALTIDHLRSLLRGAAASTSGCAATRHDGHRGVPAVISATMLRRAQELQGDRGFGSWLAQLPAEQLWCLDAPELQLDIDTARDEAGAVAAGWLDAVTAD